MSHPPFRWPAMAISPDHNGDDATRAVQRETGSQRREAVSAVLERTANRLGDHGTRPEAMAVIGEAVREWAEEHAGRTGVIVAPGERDAIAQAVYDERYGLGPLEEYLRDPQVENVDVNGCDQVWVSYATGERVGAPPIADSDEDLIAIIRRMAARSGQTARDFSGAAPLVNVALPSGVRMTATMTVTPRPCVSLRRHGQLGITISGLAELGTVDPVLADFLTAAVKAKFNIIVTGGVNAGKTTLLRALASAIPQGERIATLETEYELRLHGTAAHPDVIAFEEREPNSEGVGAITLHELIAHALRHNPQRILVGEVRRAEIMPMLEAMNSGQEGSMCTLHANSAAEVFDRILILGLRGGLGLSERAIHILAGMAIDLVVHIRKRYDGTRTVRYVAEILEVMPPADTLRPAVNRLFTPEGPAGRAVARHSPSPEMLHRLQAAGFDPRLLDHHKAMALGGWQ